MTNEQNDFLYFLEIRFLVFPLFLNRGLQAAEAAEDPLQRIATAFQDRLRAHLVDTVLQNAAHRLINQLLAVGAHLIDRFVMESQAVAATFNNAVHLGFQLRVKFGQTAMHAAAGADLLGNDFIQRLTPFFDSRTRAVINPWQAAAQAGLIILGLLTLGRSQRILFSVIGQIAVRFNHQIAVLPCYLHLMRAEDHVVTRRDATLVVRVRGQSGNGQRHRQQRFAHHKTPLRQNGSAIADPCQT